jgi:ATP-binding cassette subfamily B protein
MKYLNNLLKYLFRFIPFYLIGIATLIFVDILQLITPKIIGETIDGIKQNNFLLNDIIINVLKLFMITVMIFFGRIIWRLFIFGSSRKIEDIMRCDLFKHLESLSMNFYNKNKTGELMAHFTNDLAAVRMAIGPGFMMAVDSIVLTAMVIINMIIFVNLKLTLFSFMPLPLIGIGGYFFGKALSIRFKEKQESFGKLTDFAQETFNGIRVIKAFVQEKNYLNEFLKHNNDYYNKNIKLAKLYSFAFPLVEFISGCSFLITLIYGGYLTMIGKLSLGKFVAFNQYLAMLIWPMIAIGWCINIFSQGLASQKRVSAIFYEKSDIFDKKNIKQKSIKNGKIEFKNLSFKYKNSNGYVLKNINLKINPGETLGIVGKTGSGKTTLVNLLIRLYNPKKNQIFIDNCDILDIPLLELRKFIKIVPQESILFSTTIKENIMFGLENNNESKMIEASMNSNIHKNIMQFPLKYETVIGEKGITLSGGQKQRISIARALILEPDLLILDDSLSSVDTKTESIILKNLKNLRKDKTTIIIAHRISSIQSADKIIFLENGQITEHGTHRELLKLKGKYYSMYKKQQIEKKMED